MVSTTTQHRPLSLENLDFGYVRPTVVILGDRLQKAIGSENITPKDARAVLAIANEDVRHRLVDLATKENFDKVVDKALLEKMLAAAQAPQASSEARATASALESLSSPSLKGTDFRAEARATKAKLEAAAPGIKTIDKN